MEPSSKLSQYILYDNHSSILNNYSNMYLWQWRVGYDGASCFLKSFNLQKCSEWGTAYWAVIRLVSQGIGTSVA